MGVIATMDHAFVCVFVRSMVWWGYAGGCDPLRRAPFVRSVVRSSLGQDITPMVWWISWVISVSNAFATSSFVRSLSEDVECATRVRSFVW